MSALARYLARRLWAAMLWLMRRTWMVRLQRRSLDMFPAALRPRAHESFVRQNRFARRYGLGLITVMLNVLLASITITASYMLALNMYDRGFLTLPDEVIERTQTASH